jgi:iron complex outermembrane receptor protein
LSATIWLALSIAGIATATPTTPPDEATDQDPKATAWSDSLNAFVLLGEIIVTGDRWREELHARTETVTSEDLATQPGQTASEVLKSVPGVTISSGRKDEASISIRGFDSRRVSIMVDGRPMNIPYYGTFNLSSVHADKLEKVVVVRGPTSVTYGSNVMGGVVNFVTARGSDHPGTRLRVLAGSNDTGEVLLNHGAVRGPYDLYLSLRGGGSEGTLLPRSFVPTGYPGTEDGGTRDNSDFTEWDFFGKLGYGARGPTDLALSWGYHALEKGVPAAVDEERYWRFTDWRRYFGDATLRHRLSPNTHLEAKGYGDVFINTLVDYEDDTYDKGAVFYNSTHHNWDVGGIASLEHRWSPSLHGTYGLSLREDQIKKRMNPEDPWLYHHQVTGSVHTEHRGRLSRGLWGSCGLSDNFMVYNHLKDVRHILGLSAGLTAKLSDAWSVSGSVGQGSRFPTLSQLWSLNSGNRDLRPEVTRRIELGADGRPARDADVQVALFYNHLRDLIDRDVYRAGRYYNISSARSWGMELSGSKRLSGWLELRSSYTHTRTENRDTGDPLDLIPEHKIDGRIVGFSSSKDTHWVFSVTHVGSRFDSESLTADRMLERYTTLDCRVSTELGRHLRMSLDVMNIGDLNYEEEVMYPAPGRTVLVSATVDL